MKNNRIRVLTLITALAPVIITAIVYNRLPDLIPMNWGFDGRVSYDAKVNIWWIAGMSPAIALLFLAIPKIDPRKKNYEKFRGFYDGFCLFMMLFLLGMTIIIISEALTPGRIAVSTVIVASTGLLFIFLGNMMPKIKNNFFVGIRTPWTLSSVEVWNKTHRLGGYLWFFAGFLIVALSFLMREHEVALYVTFMAIVFVIAILPAVMSYVWYQKLPESEEIEPKSAE
jgi:uncharacterized membrane protein